MIANNGICPDDIGNLQVGRNKLNFPSSASIMFTIAWLIKNVYRSIGEVVGIGEGFRLLNRTYQ